MSGERQPEAGCVDVQTAALGVVHEHGLAEAEFPGERLPGGLVGVVASVAYDPERVAVPAVGAAEHAQDVDAGRYVVVIHSAFKHRPGTRPARGRYPGGAR